jgi:hypothetical protein
LGFGDLELRAGLNDSIVSVLRLSGTRKRELKEPERQR